MTHENHCIVKRLTSDNNWEVVNMSDLHEGDTFQLRADTSSAPKGPYVSASEPYLNKEQGIWGINVKIHFDNLNTSE